MTEEVVVTGLVHLALIAALAALPQQVLLTPSCLQRVLMGLVCGLASSLIAVQVVPADPSAVPHPHPALLASTGFLLGPVAGAVAALASLSSQWFAAAAHWSVAIAFAATALGVGLAWRYVRQAAGLPVLAAIALLAATLPLALLPWVAGASAPEGLGDWLWHTPPWRYVMGTVVLCGGAELLRSRAYSLHTLRQREEDLLGAIRASGGGRWEWDTQKRQFAYFGRFYRAFGLEGCLDDNGFSPPFIVSDIDAGRRWHERCHPDDRTRLRPYLRRVLNGQEETYQAEFRLRDEHGRWRWLISRGRAVKRDAQGHVLLLAGMDLDITEHYAMRDAMRASETKYTTVYQTLPDAAGITRLSDGCYIDINPAFERLLGRPRAELLGRTSLELGVWPDAAERERLLDALRRHGEVRGLPMTAQRAGEKIPGLMSARTARIADEDCLVFVFHDMTQEQRVRDELLAANSLLRQAGRMARLGVWEEVPGQGITYWSDVCFEIHGLSPGQPLPRDYVNQFVTPAWREIMSTTMRRCLREQSVWNLEIEITRTDGRAIWVRVHGEPIVEAGRVVRIRGILQDIDEWRRALEKLRASEERLALIFKVMPYPVGFSRQKDGVYLDVNPAWEQVVGYTREEAQGHTALSLGVYEAQARANMLEAVRTQGQLVSYEMELTTRSGEKRTVLQSMSPIEVNGEASWLFALHDITERKRAEQQVREREELLSLTIAAAALGLWDWDLQRGEITGDTRWRDMNDLPEAEGETAAPVHWTARIAPEEVGLVMQALQHHIAEPSVPYDVTCRIPLRQGGNRWIRSLGKIVAHGAQGRPARMVGMSIDVTNERTQEQQLERMALYDALTGLPNRVLLERRLREAMEQCTPRGQQLGVAYLDLDGFKPVNDRLGHAAGDRLLVIVAERLKRALRTTDCVARLGGDEFVLLLPGLSTSAECEDHLRTVMASVSAPYTLDTERVVITASIGYTVYPEDGADTDTLLRHADQAMYAAKQAGRNRFHAFDAVQERALQAQREQSAQFTAALERGELQLYLQPKVDMRRGTVVGAEALARWHHPQRGVLAPGEFLHLVESSAELQAVFGEWVVDTALDIVASLMRQGLSVPVSINITPEHLRRHGFADWMASRLALRPEVPAYLLHMELTESAALYDMDHVAHELTRLRALGMSISFDDFGTGYSSLAYLRRLPMDHLKLDRSFVTGMTTDPGDRAIVQGVIGLARSFGYQIVAEGVETVEQGLMLLQMDCTLAQGYCIARPMPAADFPGWAASWQAPEAWRAMHTHYA